MTFQKLYEYVFSKKINPVILAQMLEELGVTEVKIQPIVEYVMYTTWNTNAIILKQLIEEDEDSIAEVGKSIVGRAIVAGDGK